MGASFAKAVMKRWPKARETDLTAEWVLGWVSGIQEEPDRDEAEAPVKSPIKIQFAEDGTNTDPAHD
jgi:hypothetical protein